MSATTERAAPAKHDYDRIPYLVAYQNNSAVRDVYGGIAELVVLESYLLKPRNRVSDTVLVFMHPIGGGAYLPMINALARAGHHVIYCNSRFRGTDSALLMEKVVEDLGECIRDAKERLGYTKVVLAGWSGGGSLSAGLIQFGKRWPALSDGVVTRPRSETPRNRKRDHPRHRKTETRTPARTNRKFAGLRSPCTILSS